MDGYAGLFIAEDDEKIIPYLELLRNSIYEYLAIELFEDTARCSSGSAYVDLREQFLKFTAGSQEYISTNLINGAVTTYNNDCIFYANVLAGAPTFYISSNDGANWNVVTSGMQYIHSNVSTTATYRIKVVSNSSADKIESLGLIFSRKPKFRIVIDEQS